MGFYIYIRLLANSYICREKSLYDLTMRDTTIAVTEDERKAIDMVAEDMFGGSDVPYGFTITQLIRRHTDVNLTDLEE